MESIGKFINSLFKAPYIAANCYKMEFWIYISIILLSIILIITGIYIKAPKADPNDPNPPEGSDAPRPPEGSDAPRPPNNTNTKAGFIGIGVFLLIITFFGFPFIIRSNNRENLGYGRSAISMTDLQSDTVQCLQNLNL